ncbi:hypothetical protein EJB05_31334, partial [Eragrostis curvula]
MSPMIRVLESPLLGEFIAYLKANWTGQSHVDQRRRRLHQLIVKVRAVTDAAARHAVRDGSLAAWLHMLREEALRGEQVLDAARCDAAAVASSTRRFLSGLRGLVACDAEVDRLTGAVEELERLAGPGGDLDHFLKVLRLNGAGARATAMEVDGGGGRSWDSVDPAPPVPGAKRKRAWGSGGASSSSHGQDDSVVEQRKRRVLGGGGGGGGAAAPLATLHVRRPLPRAPCAVAGASPSLRTDGSIGHGQGPPPHWEAGGAAAAAKPRRAPVAAVTINPAHRPHAQRRTLETTLSYNSRNMTGIGTTKGTKETTTTTTNSSANIFPKSRKLSDNGFLNLLGC